MKIPATSPSSLQAYDRELALNKVGGNAAIADELLELLVADLPKQSSSLRSACSKLDAESVREVAHRVHGAASCCGTPALKHAAMELEDAATAGDHLSLASAHEAVQKEIDRLLREQDGLSPE